MEGMNLSWGRRTSRLLYVLVGITAALILVAMITPNLLRSRMAVPSAGIVREMSSQPLQKLARYSDASIATTAAAVAERLDRKVVRNGAIAVIVDNPAAALDQINVIAYRYNGYVVSSELTGTQQNQRGNATVRVPATQFDAARTELKKMAKHVESEQTSSDDVTMQLAESEATLRNFRAEEASYLEIMKRSGVIRDTLQVAQQLADVRGRIERLAAQIRTTSMQTEMASIQVAVGMEPIAVAPQHWRPWYELRAAWNDGVDALASYVTAMMAVLLYLPAVLAWLITLIVGAKLALMLLRVGYRWFVPKSQVTAA